MSAFQKIICSGDLTVENVYDSLTQSNNGRIRFIDSFGTNQGQIRSFNTGFNQSLVIDSSGMPQGVNFRTDTDQGPTDIGGTGKEYVCYIDALGLQAKYITIVPWTDDQFGRPVINALRESTAYSGSSHTFMEMLKQRSFTYGENISCSIGGESGFSATTGFCATTGDPTFPDCVGYLGMYENMFGIHIKAIVWDTSGKVGIGNSSPTETLDVTGNIKSSGTVSADTVSATTYIGLPTTSVLPITLDTVNTRVGINTVSPGYTLDVNGECNIGGNLTVNDTLIKASMGDPEGMETASVGSLFMRKDGSAGTTLYTKESGTGNTGWVAVGGGGGGIGTIVSAKKTTTTVLSSSVTNITNITVTAGTWILTAYTNAGTNTQPIHIGISTSSTVLPTWDPISRVDGLFFSYASSSSNSIVIDPTVSTTYYLLAKLGGAAVTLSANCGLSALRII